MLWGLLIATDALWSLQILKRLYPLWRLILRTLHKRLSSIQTKVPSKQSPEEKAAFNELMSYMDSLATRKASGEKTAQDEIEAVSALLSSK